MPELHFKGKEFVYNHHLSVPYCPLVPNAKKSIGDADLSGNLIIHGDNLVALKALLPFYAGKVDCIFIDPPYNTGTENWSYNDAVNSPIMREWLNSNPVNKDDMLRHDKWLCMMYPRVKLLHELLSERGSLWVTLDDNEVHHARAMLNEIFGDNCFVGQLVWQKRTSRENRTALSPSFDHILLYSKCLADTWRLVRNLLDVDGEIESNPDNDPRGPWKSIPFSAQGFRTNQVYPITTPTGKVLKPPKGRCWGATEDVFEKLKKDKQIYWPKGGDGRPRVKSWENAGLVPETLWLARDVGDTEDSKKELLSIFSDRETTDFHAPKPPRLVQRVVQISTDATSIVLDSFAGTGTTAHAVLAQNKKDGGQRKFVLVEGESYADSLTAERVRRVIKGYRFDGVDSEELYSKKLNVTSLKSADKILAHIASIENLEEHRFDAIRKEVSGGVLVVSGERKVNKKTEGLGGVFTYCSLGEPIDMDKLLTGERMPKYEALGAWLFHTATGEAVKAKAIDQSNWFLGESAGFFVWLVYKSNLDFLKSRDAALTLELAERIAKMKDAKGANKRHLVFAPAKYVPNKMLLPLGVEHAPLPFALYRVEKS
jgi:adenine-specific DNA-methyltransferase